MDRIYFSVNGEQCSVGGEVDSDEMLVDYLRARLELRGTKYMCREGDCGACVVAVTAPHPLTKQLRTFSVNSCLVGIYQCQDWAITTVEGIGDRKKGYHPVQRTLAEYNGSQCGHCSPGWVMAMYSLLEANHYDLTQYQIEDSFASNTCRCTGYRPILEAFKSFAKDAPKPKDIKDIEDLNICKNKGENCKATCNELKDWCLVDKEETEEKTVKKVKLKDGRTFYRVNEMKEIFDVLNAEGYDSYTLLGGNTGKGPYHIFENPRVLIDTAGILELRQWYLDQNLVIGAGTTLADLMVLFRTISSQHEDFGYLEKLIEHLNLVANLPVRNIGSFAGNLMVKHRVPEFSSDVFLLFETIRAVLTIVDKAGASIQVTPAEFLSLDMTGRLIKNVIIPPYAPNYRFVSFKIMPRSQNAHAQVNAAFLYEFNKKDPETVNSARIVIGGISKTFVHASKTEKFLIGKEIFTNEVLQGALKVLDEELVAEYIAGELSPEYKRKCALGLFYKGLLVLIPKHLLEPRYRSGARDLRKTRPVSRASDVYDTNPLIWPITEPSPKIEALIQCAGELKYVNDVPTDKREVFAAFVTADVGRGEIEHIDPAPALKYPGVLAFYSAKDIPGKNNFFSLKLDTPIGPGVELIFAERMVQFYDQAIGMIVAETEPIANRAALLVQVKYKTQELPILTINEARRRDPSRVTFFYAVPARSRGADVERVIKDTHNIFSQYYFTMETISCLARPSDEGVHVIPGTHWPDLTHIAVADALGIAQNRVTMDIFPCGGSYGSRLSRSTQVAVACALAAYLQNRPVRFIMSIQANMRVIGKRLPATRDFEVGVNNSGEIQYLEYHLYDDNGCVVSDLIVYLAIGAVKNCYDSQRWSFKLFNVVTDNTSNSWCRSPGTLEAIAMTEYIMEQISYEIDRDPLEVRMNNINRTELPILEIVKTITEDSEYYKRKEEVKEFNQNNRWKKRGLRVALMSWSAIIISDYQVLLSVYHGDGTVDVRHGGVEVGQGINTKVIQCVAFALDIPTSKVRVKRNDTVSNPNSNLTGSSRTTETVCFGAIKCCQILLDRLQTTREALMNPAWDVLIQVAYRAGINLQTSYHTTSNDQSSYRVDGAAVAEVELDILTGEHEVTRVDIVQDAGTSMNPALDLGQVEGAFIMGLGYWTSEHLIYDERTGELLTDRTWYYDVPKSKDIPIDFRVQLRRNSYNPAGALGSRAVAEPPLNLAISVAFALREAIVSSREDSGFSRREWFNVDGPYTLEENVLKSEARLDEFLFN